MSSAAPGDRFPDRYLIALGALQKAPRAWVTMLPAETWPDARVRLDMDGADYAAAVLADNLVMVYSTARVPGSDPLPGTEAIRPVTVAFMFMVQAEDDAATVRVELSERWAAWCGRRDADRIADPATPAT